MPKLTLNERIERICDEQERARQAQEISLSRERRSSVSLGAPLLESEENDLFQSEATDTSIHSFSEMGLKRFRNILDSRYRDEEERQRKVRNDFYNPSGQRKNSTTSQLILDIFKAFGVPLTSQERHALIWDGSVPKAQALADKLQERLIASPHSETIQQQMLAFLLNINPESDNWYRDITPENLASAIGHLVDEGLSDYLPLLLDNLIKQLHYIIPDEQSIDGELALISKLYQLVSSERENDVLMQKISSFLSANAELAYRFIKENIADTPSVITVFKSLSNNPDVQALIYQKLLFDKGETHNEHLAEFFKQLMEEQITHQEIETEADEATYVYKEEYRHLAVEENRYRLAKANTIYQQYLQDTVLQFAIAEVNRATQYGYQIRLLFDPQGRLLHSLTLEKEQWLDVFIRIKDALGEPVLRDTYQGHSAEELRAELKALMGGRTPTASTLCSIDITRKDGSHLDSTTEAGQLYEAFTLNLANMRLRYHVGHNDVTEAFDAMGLLRRQRFNVLGGGSAPKHASIMDLKYLKRYFDTGMKPDTIDLASEQEPNIKEKWIDILKLIYKAKGELSTFEERSFEDTPIKDLIAEFKRLILDNPELVEDLLKQVDTEENPDLQVFKVLHAIYHPVQDKIPQAERASINPAFEELYSHMLLAINTFKEVANTSEDLRARMPVEVWDEVQRHAGYMIQAFLTQSYNEIVDSLRGEEGSPDYIDKLNRALAQKRKELAGRVMAQVFRSIGATLVDEGRLEDNPLNRGEGGRGLNEISHAEYYRLKSIFQFITQRLDSESFTEHTATGCDYFHTTEYLQQAALISGTHDTAHDKPKFYLNRSEDQAAFRRVVYSHIDSDGRFQATTGINARIPSPTLVFGEFDSDAEIITDVKLKYGWLHEQMRAMRGGKDGPAVENLFTSFHSGLYENTPGVNYIERKNRQRRSVLAMMKAMHQFNSEQVGDGRQNYLFVQNIGTNRHTRDLGYWQDKNFFARLFTSSTELDDITLSADMAFVHTLLENSAYMSPEIRATLRAQYQQMLINYESFLKSPAPREEYFAASPKGQEQIALIRSLKQTLKDQQPLSVCHAYNLPELASQAVLTMFTHNHHWDLRYGNLVQALSMYVEWAKSGGCKSGNERNEEVMKRFALFVSIHERVKRGGFSELSSAEKAIYTELQHYIKNPSQEPEALRVHITQAVNKHYNSGAESSISREDQGAPSKVGRLSYIQDIKNPIVRWTARAIAFFPLLIVSLVFKVINEIPLLKKKPGFRTAKTFIDTEFGGCYGDTNSAADIEQTRLDSTGASGMQAHKMQYLKAQHGAFDAIRGTVHRFLDFTTDAEPTEVNGERVDMHGQKKLFVENVDLAVGQHILIDGLHAVIAGRSELVVGEEMEINGRHVQVTAEHTLYNIVYAQPNDDVDPRDLTTVGPKIIAMRETRIQEREEHGDRTHNPDTYVRIMTEHGWEMVPQTKHQVKAGQHAVDEVAGLGAAANVVDVVHPGQDAQEDEHVVDGTAVIIDHFTKPP